MTAWFSEAHRLHAGLKEFSCGQWLEGFELPVRAQAVRERFLALRLGAVREPMDRGLVPLARVHDADYLDFLPHAWTPWSARGRRHPALPMFWRAAATTPQRAPTHRRAARLLQPGRQVQHRCRHLDCGLLERAVRAGGCGRPAGRRTELVRRLPAAPPPCHGKGDGGLLRPQQRGHRCAPPGTIGAEWLQALDVALARVVTYGAEALRVSLGVDTFERDPISAFKSRSDDCPQVAAVWQRGVCLPPMPSKADMPPRQWV